MSKKSSHKIFLKKNNKIMDFMWVNVSRSDGTVIMGFSGNGFKEDVIKIFDLSGELNPIEHFDIENQDVKIKQAKISFHPSGKYKATNKVKIKKSTSDRVTVQGKAFSEISELTRMAEFILPNILSIAEKKISDNDLVFDITEFPNKPLRCTLSCMPKCDYERCFKNNNYKVVDTSLCELSDGFEVNDLVWIWTMRISNNDHNVQSQFIVFILGQVLWPGHIGSTGTKNTK